MRWENLGRVLHADGSVWWMVQYTGPAAAVARGGNPEVTVYITGRDVANRSMIGRGRLLPSRPQDGISVEAEPVLVPGSLGAFDENGVSYPSVVEAHDGLRMYYVGWMPTVLTPFQNHIGVARLQASGGFERMSRAPILPRTDADYLSMGSCCVVRDGAGWRMWYTAFTDWGAGGGEPKHRYVIKHAHSQDGIEWHRSDEVCIGPVHDGEHSISRPTVVHHRGTYHMWFCWRGAEYRLGYAVSPDGVRWQRQDAELGLAPSGDGWDARAQAYPSVFWHGEQLYMLYCGNDYGRDGLGLARLDKW